jgi:triosephosphate isomerase (TIM)
MNRKKLIAGNWKMYTTAARAQELAAGIVRGVTKNDRVNVAVCPPFPYLLKVAETLRGSSVLLGAQNVYPASEGAFTGEVSPAMLLDVGCRYVIVGHSERRHVVGESYAFIQRKVDTALTAGLSVILCVGETLEQRERDETEAVLDGQITSAFKGLSVDRLEQVVLAYEPVWAIGTGRNATPEQAQQVHAFLRGRCTELFGATASERLLIQYGGSVKPDNAASLLSQPDVDGALVGGASLKADSFLAIVAAA